MKHLIFITTFLLLIFNKINAQQVILPNFSFTNYTTKDGLCGNEVVKTVNDKNGFLWIATHNGLSRFDGKNFKTYTYLPNDSTSLRSIWITDLLLDSNKVLWATTEWGICWYDDAYDRFRYINKKNEIIVLYKAPMVLDNKNNIWVVCENGLFTINTTTKLFYKISTSSIAVPQCIAIDNQANIWIGTLGNGLHCVNINTGTQTLFKSKNIASSTDFLQFYKDEDILWVATSEGLLQIGKDNKTAVFKFGEKNISPTLCTQLTTVTAFDTFKLVCGTFNKRLLIFDKLTQKFIHEWKFDNNLPNAAYINIHQAKDFIWLSTQNGLTKMQKGFRGFDFINLGNTIKNKSFQKVLHDNNRANLYWLIDGGIKPTLVLFDTEKKVVVKTAFCNSITNTAYNKSSILQLSNGMLYSFSNKYINSFTKEGIWQNEIVLKEKIYSSCFDADKNILLGTENGIATFNVNTKSIKYFPFFFNGTEFENKSFEETFPVNGIAVNSKGEVWLANLKYGLFSFNIKNNMLTPHRQISKTSYETLNRCAAVIANEDTVWVGNMSGLTAYIISKNKFVNYNSSNGLASAYVYHIAKTEDGNIWGRGNVGVFYFNNTAQKFTNQNMPATFDALYYAQGVTAHNGNCLLSLENAFAIFNNKSEDTTPVTCLITLVAVNDKRIFNTGETHQLKYFENNIQFDFASINLYNEPQIFYYKLDGLNVDWIEATGKDNVLFTNLSAGKYLFNVKVKRLNDGIYGAIQTYAFEIKAAFWQTWIFKLLVILLFIIAIIYFSQRKIKSIEKKEKEKTAVNKMMGELETKLMRSQMNPHFIFNSLNSIQKYIWENKEEAAAEYLSNFAKLIRAILENSKKDFITLKEELTILKIYIDLEQRRSNNKFDYTINVDNTLETDFTLIPPMLLQPFIENAIWHGLNKKEERGNLHLQILQKDDDIIFTIDDDGVGRTKTGDVLNTEKKSLGIEITKQRIALLLNKQNVDYNLVVVDKKLNEKPLGTTIIITLPIKYVDA